MELPDASKDVVGDLLLLLARGVLDGFESERRTELQRHPRESQTLPVAGLV
jgi:hypothetical protein